MINHKISIARKNEFAGILGFKNTVEAICCLGPKVFNNQFKEFSK